MTTLMTKSSLYDMLSMIIPGFITIISVAEIFGCGMDVFKSNEDFAVIRYICIFVASYLVGMLIHYASKYVFDEGLRNKPKHIEVEKKNFNDDEAKKPEVVKDYYKKYYQVIKTTSVPILEAQVSFIRSMVIVIPLSCIALCRLIYCDNVLDCCCNNNNYCAFLWCRIIILLPIINALLIRLMFRIQKKIYNLVFEGAYYMDLVNVKHEKQEDEKENSKDNETDETPQ